MKKEIWSGNITIKKTHFYLVATVAVFGAAVSTVMLTAGPVSPLLVSKPQANAIVERLTHHQAHVVRVFPGPVGLTGMILSGQKGPLVAWMTNSRSAVIIGGVVDTKTNKNLTMQATARFVPSKGYILPHGALNDTAASSRSSIPGPASLATGVQPAGQPAALPVSAAVSTRSNAGEPLLRAFIQDSQEGRFAQVSQPGLSGPHVLYAFVDPNCIFCHKLFDYVQTHKAEFQKAGVRVVYTPVAILKQSSIAKAAEIVKEGWPAMLRNEQRFNVNSEEGGLAGLAGGSVALSHYSHPVQVNTQWMDNLATSNHAEPGTPFLVWQAGNGRAYYLSGFPSGPGFKMLFASIHAGWTPGKK